MFSQLPVINDHAYISHTWIQTYVIPQVHTSSAGSQIILVFV